MLLLEHLVSDIEMQVIFAEDMLDAIGKEKHLLNEMLRIATKRNEDDEMLEIFTTFTNLTATSGKVHSTTTNRHRPQ
jgi:hypothetical protein